MEDSDEDSDSSDKSLDIEGRRTEKNERIGPKISRENWAKVGRLAYTMLRECPSLNYM